MKPKPGNTKVGERSNINYKKPSFEAFIFVSATSEIFFYVSSAIVEKIPKLEKNCGSKKISLNGLDPFLFSPTLPHIKNIIYVYAKPKF